MTQSKTTNPQQMKKIRYGALVCCLLFFVSGCIILPMSFFRYRDARQSTRWPTVEATILDSRVEQTTIWVKYQGTKPYFKPWIEYAYMVDGVEYNGKKVSFTEHSGSVERSWADSIVSLYPKGKTVQAHYKPSDPNLSVLEPGTNTDNFVVIIAGIGCFVFATLLFGINLLMKRELAVIDT